MNCCGAKVLRVQWFKQRCFYAVRKAATEKVPARLYLPFHVLVQAVYKEPSKCFQAPLHSTTRTKYLSRWPKLQNWPPGIHAILPPINSSLPPHSTPCQPRDHGYGSMLCFAASSCWPKRSTRAYQLVYCNGKERLQQLTQGIAAPDAQFASGPSS